MKIKTETNQDGVLKASSDNDVAISGVVPPLGVNSEVATSAQRPSEAQTTQGAQNSSPSENQQPPLPPRQAEGEKSSVPANASTSKGAQRRKSRSKGDSTAAAKAAD